MEGCASRIGDGAPSDGTPWNKVRHLGHRSARAMGHFGTKWNTWDTDPRDCPSPGPPRCPSTGGGPRALSSRRTEDTNPKRERGCTAGGLACASGWDLVITLTVYARGRQV